MGRYKCWGCGVEREFSTMCRSCLCCWDCVAKCTEDRCIDCCEDRIMQMKCIWETRFKPQIGKLLEMEDGQYLALVAVCHACEHAYRAIVCDNKHVMQEALEAALRLHYFLSVNSDTPTLDVAAEPFKHWGKVEAYVLRDLLLNPTKHEGRLTKGTRLLYEPNRAVSSTISSMTPEYSAILEAGGTIRVRDVRQTVNAHFYISHLMSGIDQAYSLFANDGKAHNWFTPSNCGKGCEDCRKDMMKKGLEVKSKSLEEERRIRRHVRTEQVAGRFYLSVEDELPIISISREPIPEYERNLHPNLDQICMPVVCDLRQEYSKVKRENDKFNEPTPKLEVVLPSGNIKMFD